MHVRWLGVAGVLVAGSFGVFGAFGTIEPAGAAAPIAGSTVPPAGWSAPDVVARCRGVVSTARADYEAIVATARDAGGALAIGMRADAAFPLATYEAKVCVWRDRDGDRQIDASEEPTVAAFFGPLTWPAGARDAEVRASGQAAAGSPPGSCQSSLAASWFAVVPATPTSSWTDRVVSRPLRPADPQVSRRRVPYPGGL